MDSMTNDNDLFNIMRTTRAMRRLKPDPVPDELSQAILEAATWAASGANQQTWRFLVVKDREVKHGVQQYYARAFDEFVLPHYRRSGPPPGVTPERFERQIAAVQYLTEHFHEAPVWIVACLAEERPGVVPSGASIYPAVQNMLLAARALGLGGTLTTRHLVYKRETEAILGLPETFHSFAILPIGYPLGRFGPVSRRPVADIAYLERWGKPFTVEAPTTSVR
jgi:nitroreductase